MKKIFALALCVLLALSAVGCGNKKTAGSAAGEKIEFRPIDVSNAQTIEAGVNRLFANCDADIQAEGRALVKRLLTTDVKSEKTLGFQMEKPEKGELIVVIESSMGTIKMRLFPDEAPIAVANFLSLVGQEYYDGLVIHRVAKDYVVQGGDPKGTGRGGDKGVDRPMESSFNGKTCLLRGAVSYAHSGDPSAAKSQFFIVQSKTNPQAADVRQKETEGKYPAGTTDLYDQYGGTPGLDGVITDYTFITFGQVFEGLDVVDNMNDIKTSPAGDGYPNIEITLETVRLEKY